MATDVTKVGDLLEPATGRLKTERGGSEPWRVGLAAFLLNALASLVFTALSVATPYIGTALGVSSQDELWLTDAFLIALICVTPLSGFLAAKLGARRLLLGCAALTTCFFTVGTLFEAIAVLTALCFMAGRGCRVGLSCPQRRL